MPGLNLPLPRLRIYTSRDQYRQVIGDLLARRATDGDDVVELERTLEARLGIAHAVAMPMARVGIYLALKCTVKPGQKVILSPYTIADVVNMVVCAGGVPVFADIDRRTCNINPEDVERLIDADTGAVLVTHFYGMMADVKRIGAICRRYGVPMIEDAAQAFGASLAGRPAGTFGKAGVYSFGMYKNVNAFFGGMLVTDDDGLADGIRREIAQWPYMATGRYVRKVVAAALTDVITFPPIFQGFAFWLFRHAFLNGVDAVNNRLKIDVDPKLSTVFPHEYRGRMIPLQARLILSQLSSVDEQTRLRIAAARLYHEGLRDLTDLILPPMRENGSHMYWYYPIQYAKRHELVAFAMRQFRDITESYHRNCAALPCFAAFARPCPNAQATADSLIYLPTYPRYTHDQVHRTIEVIRRFLGR
jgi:perosamine synthetase